MATGESLTVPAEAIGSARGGSFVARWAARHGVHYSWVVVGVAFFVVVAASGVRATPGVLIRPLERDFGWSRSEISLAIALSLLVYGLASPLSGRIADRFGLRAMTLAFLATSGVGVALSATIAHLWQMQLFWGVIVGLGTGGVATVMGAIVANIWFESRRGLVVGMIGGAASAGQLIFLPLLVWITSEWGWRTALGFLGTLMLAVILPLAFLLMRSRPQDVGLQPYGTGAGAAGAVKDDRVTPISQAVRTGDFWLLASTFFVCGFTTVGLIGAHFIPHATEHGFSEAQAAGILSLIGAMNVVGTLASGWLCDRYPPRLLLATYYFLRALSLLVLPFISTLPFMSVFAVVFGLDYIATVPPTVMLTAERFGRRSVGSIYGWITFAHMVGGAIASYAAGYIHDVADEYSIAFYLAGLLGLLAAMMAFGINSGARQRGAAATGLAGV
ncbi:MAG TPA: MFS transporter [Dehalococcoidia bacterium]